MYHRAIISILLVALFSACSTPKEPEFNRMENTKVKKMSSSEIIILTDAVFDNPNGFGVVVSSIDLIAKVNEVETAKVKQTADVDMISNSEFSIPLEIKVNPKELLTVANTLKLVAGSLEKKVLLNYKGTTKVKIMDISYVIPIDYSEEILLTK